MREWAEKAATLIEHTTMPIAEVASRCGVTRAAVTCWYVRAYTPEFRSERKRDNYRKSKLGDRNPMKGKYAEKHHNFIGRSSDHKGYYTLPRPVWWTGPNKNRVFEHHVVYALAHGLTEIPAGMHIHHIDHDPGNNAPENLEMLTPTEHRAKHVQNVSGDDDD